MDSYSLHFERMSNVDLHPLSLSVSRLSPAKSNSSIVDHLAHHQHGKGDSAYSSFSGGSTAPDYPSPFLPDDLQSSSFSHYADLKYVKSFYHPTQFLQSDSKTMDQLCRSVEAISQQYRNKTDVNYHSHNGNESLHTNDNAHPKKEVHLRTPSQSDHAAANPPPVPTRLDSFIATKNLENSRLHLHGTEFKPLPQQPQQQLRPHSRPHSQSLNAKRSETVILDKGSSSLSSEPVYSVWRSPHEIHQAQHPPSYRLHLQLHNQIRVNPENPSILDRNAASEPHGSPSSLSPPQGRHQPEHLTPKQPSSSSGCNGDHQNQSSTHFRSERKRAHSAQEWLGGSEPQQASSPRNSSQSFLSSSIQHKGQFYFVTGVYKPSESGMRTHSATISGTEAAKEVSAVLETPRQRDKERSHSTMDNFFRSLQESSHPSSSTIPEDEEVFLSVGQRMDPISKSLDQENYRPSHILNVLDESCEIGRHTASNPIFYCGPDRRSPPHSAAHQNELSRTTTKLQNYKKEDHINGGNRQPLENVASERINKETTPLLYHLTGASRTVLQPKTDPGFSGGKEPVLIKAVLGDVAVNENEKPAQCDTSQNHRGEVLSVACGTLDDSFKKYYKEKLKDAQCKVLRETSFKRRDLQLPWPHSLTQNSECRPAVIHSFSSSQDSEISTDTLTPSLTSEDTEKGSITEVWENQKEIDKSAERENGRMENVAQPQVARIRGRKRLTPGQKKMCFSEPEKLNELGDTPNHSVCRSFGNEREALFTECEGEDEMQQAEQGLVAARRKLFESRGRALSVSNASKTNLKYLRHQALMEYMERKTGQKVAEPQHPPSHLPTPSRQRHSLGEKPFDWNPRPQSWNQEKHTKKKHHRPHSAGRILDSSSSSIRYAQFFSAQSCSDHYPGHQNLSRPSQGPSQGKSASAESLLDQREPTSFLRSRSTSTPHTFQAHDNEENPLPVNTMETRSCQKNESEEPSEKQAPEGQQRSRKAGQRGKSMEELGASKIAKVSTLSKSSEHLDQTWRNYPEPAGGSTNDRSASHFAEDKYARQRETRKEAELVGQNNSYGQSQHQTQKNSPEKQSSEQGEDATGERSSSRSLSPFSSGEPSDMFSNPPSPRGQKISEWEIKSTCSTPTQTKLPCESTPISSRGGTPPGLEREQTVDESSSETNHEVSLSCGVTTDPSLWILPPEEELKEVLQNSQLTNNVSDESGSSISPKQTNDSSVSPSSSVSETEVSQQADEQKDPDLEAETMEEKEEEEEKKKRGTPAGETDSSERSANKPKWEELVKAVVKADQSLARVLCPLANRKTALMLMEQLLSEDTLLMEEHYKKKQEQKGAVESNEASEGAEPSPCLPGSDDQKSECTDEQSRADITEKKRLLVSYINEHLRSLEELRGALQAELEENSALGEAMKLLVRERCLPVELERYNLFIGDLERVVNLLLCLSARLARVQNALSVVDQHTDAEEKESLDSRHRLLCKQREDAKDLKDNLDRRENLVSTFLSRQLSAEQLQDYRRFVQTKASLLIRQKDLEEKQRLGEEQLEALSNTLNV